MTKLSDCLPSWDNNEQPKSGSVSNTQAPKPKHPDGIFDRPGFKEAAEKAMYDSIEMQRETIRKAEHLEKGGEWCNCDKPLEVWEVRGYFCDRCGKRIPKQELEKCDCRCHQKMLGGWCGGCSKKHFSPSDPVEKNGYICPFGCGKLVKFEELHKCKSGSVDHKDEKCHCICHCKEFTGKVTGHGETNGHIFPCGEQHTIGCKHCLPPAFEDEEAPSEEWVETIEKRYSECIDYRIKPELIQFIRSLLSSSNEKARKEGYKQSQLDYGKGFQDGRESSDSEWRLKQLKEDT